MRDEIKIAFFGSSLVSAYWNGAATYYRGILKALYNFGYSITFYEPDAFERQKNRDIPDPEYARVVVYQNDEKELFKCLDEASGADIIIKASGVGVFDSLLEYEVIQRKTPENVIVFWDVDAPATLDRIENNSDDPFSKLVPNYDLILTYGGGNPVVNKYKKNGAKECIPIYNALDPDTHHPVQYDQRFESSLAFLGNRMPDREHRVWEFFFKPVQLLPEKYFLLGGSGWDQNVLEKENLKNFGHVYTKDHNAFNCTPTAVLNISRESMANYGYSPATRIFEAAGAGACIITDFWEGIELFLEPGKECLVAQNGEEVADIIKSLKKTYAKEIGGAALKKVLSYHTYSHRAAELNRIFLSLPQIRREVSL